VVMKPKTVELNFDSVDALLRTYGVFSLDKLHEEIAKALPNAKFECPWLSLWTNQDRVTLSRRNFHWSEFYFGLQVKPGTIWCSKYGTD